MTRRHEVERVAFPASSPGAVVAAMARLAGARDGWINLVPRIVGTADEPSTSLGFLTLFGGGGMGVTMATWVPAGRRDDRGRPRLGITHVTGRRVVDRLATGAARVPTSWVVEQDHPRRGLVVRPPAEEAHDTVLAWAIDAIAELSAPRLIEGWRADVYPPAAS